MSKYVDLLGNEINVGNYVAFAVLTYKRASINFGLVTELAHSKSKRFGAEDPLPMIRVRLLEKIYNGEIVSRNTSTTNFSNIVIVAENNVPEKYRKFLQSGVKQLSKSSDLSSLHDLA